MFPLHKSAPETTAGPVQEQQFVGRVHVGRVMRSVRHVHHPKTGQRVRVIFVVVVVEIIVTIDTAVIIVIINTVAVGVVAVAVGGGHDGFVGGGGDASGAQVRRRRFEYRQELVDQRRLVVVRCRPVLLVGVVRPSRRNDRGRRGRTARRWRRGRSARRRRVRRKRDGGRRRRRRSLAMDVRHRPRLRWPARRRVVLVAARPPVFSGRAHVAPVCRAKRKTQNERNETNRIDTDVSHQGVVALVQLRKLQPGTGVWCKSQCTKGVENKNRPRGRCCETSAHDWNAETAKGKNERKQKAGDTLGRAHGLFDGVAIIRFGWVLFGFRSSVDQTFFFFVNIRKERRIAFEKKKTNLSELSVA